MGARRFAFAAGEFFHIYNRGNSKQKIFYDNSDYERFVRLLFIANSSNSFKLFFLKDAFTFERGEELVAIGAYCLMPNHFHVLLTPLKENGVSEFMKKVTTGYSMYFNNKYERTGALFEGRFKAEIASNDEYLKYLYAYIHLNPVKLIYADWKEKGIKDIKRAKDFIRSYPYSSFQDYIEIPRKHSAILMKQKFPEYFLNPKDFTENIFEWFQTKQVGPV